MRVDLSSRDRKHEMHDAIAEFRKVVFDDFYDRSYGWWRRGSGRKDMEKVRSMIRCIRILQFLVDEGLGGDVLLCALDMDSGSWVQLPVPEEVLN